LRCKKLLPLILFLAIAELSFSATLEELIGLGRAADLAASNPITEVQYRETSGPDPKPRLMPQDENLQRLISSAMETLSPTILVESLYRYKKPARLGASNAEAAKRTARNTPSPW
jgi:hypothetical protein